MKHDYTKKIVDVIPNHAQVLDLGCGNGTLLRHLIDEKQINGYGIEINFDYVCECIRHGIPVIQDNITECLPRYQDKSYDFVIMSQTLIEIRDPTQVINEILRIGKQCIITFSNFANWKIRLQILFGQTPKTRAFSGEWDSTESVKIMTIKNFKDYCRSHDITIVKEYAINNPRWISWLFPTWLNNVFADKGMFVIKKEL